jgi:hypothetical protein
LETVLAGDFNLDFKDKNYHKRGLALCVSSAIKASGFHLYGFDHTFRTILGTTVTSSLDYIISNRSENISSIKQLSYGLSDHTPILWTMGGRNQEEESQIQLRNISKMDRKRFLSHLASQDWESFFHLDIHGMARQFNGFVISSLDEVAPMKVVKSKRKLTPKPSPALARLRRLRDNARSKGDPISFKKLRNQCTP